MSTFFYLKSCSTCLRVIKDISLPQDSIQLQNIKEDKITEKQITEMANLAGSYEALFSRRAMKYKSMGLKEKTLSEADYKALILEEYTFLKRPVLVDGDKIFVGNAAKVVAAAKEYLAGK